MSLENKKRNSKYKALAVIIVIISLTIAIYGIYSYLSWNSKSGANSLLAGKGWKFGQTFLNLGMGVWGLIGCIVWIIGTGLFVMELRGLTFEGFRIRRFSLNWNSIDIATMALCAAIYAASILATS